MKKIIYILTTLFLTVSCLDMNSPDPYQATLNVLTVTADWPSEGLERSGAEVIVEDMNTDNRYSSVTDKDGVAVFTLPNGLYRINLSGKSEDMVFNAAADKVVVSGSDQVMTLSLAISKAGTIVVKEIYCGGCKRLPQEGNYQNDKYFILHNNDYEVQYLDGLCFGTLSPNNSNAANPWTSVDASGVSSLPDFLPVIQAVWKFPGDGYDFPLQPGEDAVVCLNGAIDHAAQFPLSVNLNKPDYFVCYNTTYFPNTAYHPAPGNLISTDRYIDVVVKTGKANAYTFSVNSPTLVLFRPEGTTIEEHVRLADSIIPVPGSHVDNVVKVPFEWVVDAVEVFNGASSSNAKRLVPSLDAGYVTLSDTYLGHTLMRKTDEVQSAAAGYEVLTDTNNSLNDFYEREIQSLHE